MSITRREFVSGICKAGAIALLPGGCGSLVRAPQGIAREGSQQPFSFVHLTDMHVTPRRRGDEGYRKCVESVRALEPTPAFALMGGDLAFDGNYHTKPQFEEYIRLYKEISDELGIPYYNCMGNHDTLGLSARRKVPPDDPEIGKKMIMDRLDWDKSYYSFDFGGWHFVVLDSIYPIKAKHGPGYEARMGTEQLEWLAYDLGAAAGRPTVAVTHIAAFCHKSHMVVADTKQLRTILERHKVKALLQGHSHQIEEYRFSDVWYLTSAAASGAWWAGSWVGSPPGYTVFQCDGDRLTWSHRTFEWEPHLEPEDELERRKIAEQKAFQAEQQRLLERERAGRRTSDQSR